MPDLPLPVPASAIARTGPDTAAEALLNLLFPFWQLVIAGCVLAAVVVSARRLSSRGPSRMARALVVTGAAIVGLAVLGVLFANL